MHYYQITIAEKDGIRDYGYFIETETSKSDLQILSILRDKHLSPDALSLEDIGQITEIFPITAQDYEDCTGLQRAARAVPANIKPAPASQPKRIDILFKQVQYPGVAAQYQTAVNAQTDEPVPYRDLYRAQIVDMFSGSNGDLVMSVELNEEA